jgi:mannan endo-1,4-beta-mannosidase
MWVSAAAACLVIACGGSETRGGGGAGAGGAAGHAGGTSAAGSAGAPEGRGGAAGNAGEASEGGAPSAAAGQREALRRQLEALRDQGLLALGHQDTTAYGIGWKWEDDRSDVKSVCGQHAGVQGWDIGHIGEANNIDGVPFTLMQERIVEGYERGAIQTISWHERNPTNDKDCWNRDAGAKELLPGGTLHEKFKQRLDAAAKFLASLKTQDGTVVPVIFRPWHEHTGNWFWWGRGTTSEEDYKALWIFTYEYLKKTKRLEQLLFAYSPSGAVGSDYFWGYPGDEYTDVLGFDHYWEYTDPPNLTAAAERLVKHAEERGKVAALTEYGVKGSLANTNVPEDWFSKQVFGPLAASPLARKLVFALTWRNEKPGAYFVPTAEDRFAADFKTWCDDPRVLLEGELPKGD